MGKLNALHRLDIVAGGNPVDIAAMGDASANQSIGSQWVNKGNREKLRSYAKEMKSNNCPMNVRLIECP